MSDKQKDYYTNYNYYDRKPVYIDEIGITNRSIGSSD
jgi:hypothetical protein